MRYSGIKRLLPSKYRRRFDDVLLGIGIGATGAVAVTLAFERDEHGFGLANLINPHELLRHNDVPDRKDLPIDHHSLSLGIPSNMHVVAKDGFVLAYDWRTRNPIWAMHHLRRSEGRRPKHVSRNNVGFVEDPQAPSAFRVKPRDFSSTNYDRGHMIPAGDAPTQSQLNDTFVMSNVSAQVGSGFNRDYWNRLEMFVRRLSKTHDDVFVVTGPLFLPHQSPNERGKWKVSYEVIGKDNPPSIAVPTHFYKSIVCKNTSRVWGTTYSTASFIVPNRPVEKDTPLETFQVGLSELESKAGLLLWTNISKREQMRNLCTGNVCALPKPRFHKKTSATTSASAPIPQHS